MRSEIKERIEKIKNKEIPSGYKKINAGIFPNEWETKKIVEISQSIKATSTKENLPVLTISAGNGFLDQKERFSKVIAGKSLEKYTYLKKGEFSYNRGNSKSFKYGCIYRLENVEEALIPNVYHSFKFNEGCTDFYKFLFANKFLDRQLRTLISSSARMDGLLNINKDDFMQLKLPFPLLKEQEKIAEILQKWDEGITKQEELIEGKKKYKKGMMQKIFSQELRFKDDFGNDYPEWEEKELGEIIDYFSGGAFPEKYQGKQDRKYPFYKVSDMNLPGNEIKMIMSNNTISEEDRVILKIKLAPKEVIIFPKVGAALLTNKRRILTKPSAFDNNMMGIIGRKELNNTFLYHFMTIVDFKSYVQEGALPSISKGIVDDIGINLPSLPEQIQIADFLSSIDREIELLEKKLEILRKEKQSLANLLLNGIVRTV